MRLALALVALVAAAGCGGPDGGAPALPHAVQVDAPAIITTRDPGVPEEVAASWGMQRDFFTDGGFELLEWEDAKALLRERDYRGGKQYHTGWLTIYTNAGRKVLTREPAIDDFYQFMEESGLPTTGFGTE